MKKTITDSDTYRIKIPFYILQKDEDIGLNLTEDNFLTAENAGDPIQELKTKVVVIII